ncbi:unnamed protein product [Linum trigynum]|uniref:Uncharacterized protein n=1 Tax=Linum trigynum TaxID=586398 RepID=A0AAV2ELS7_9ROSI
MRTANLPRILMFLMALSVVHGDVGSDQKYWKILPHPPPYCLIGVLAPGDHGGEACFLDECPFACQRKFGMLR